MSEANVVAKLIDQFSPNCIHMKDANKGFNASLSETQGKAKEYSQRIDDIIKAQAKMQTSLLEARKEMQAAQKDFANTGSKQAQENLEEATKKFDAWRLAISNSNKALKETQRNLTDLRESGNKTEGVIAQLGKAGATSMIGNLASQAIGTYAVSALGSAGGNYVSSALSSAGIGAAIGTAIMPVAPAIGASVGAALGGVAGLITAKMDELGEKDDYYRDQVQETFNSLQDAQTQSLNNGSTIAGSRQTTRISFSTLLGSEAAADELLSGVREFSNITPYMYDDMTKIARQLLAYGYSSDEIMPMLTNTGNAASALGAGTSGMGTIAEVLGRMNMGTIENEQLKRLIDLGINPYEMLAQKSNAMVSGGAAMIASGVYSAEEVANIQSMMDYVEEHGPYTAEVIKKMVTDGLIPAKMAAEALADAMGETYTGSLEAQSQTYEGLTSTLNGLQDEMDAAMGEGYNNTRMQGMRDQIAWLQEESSGGMTDAYRLMGEFQAELENQQEQLQRDAINSVMQGVLNGSWSEEAAAQLTDLISQYDEAKANDNGAEMGRVIAAAQAVAQAEYTNSEGYRTQVDANLQLVKDVQEAVSYSYYDAGYVLGQEMSKGIQAALQDGTPNIQTATMAAAGISGQAAIAERWKNPITTDTKTGTWVDNSPMAIYNRYAEAYKPHAYGLERVPYDNYPALLHEGERVLTASQARQQGGASIQIAKLADEIVVREDADIDRIAGALAERLKEAMMTGVA